METPTRLRPGFFMRECFPGTCVFNSLPHWNNRLVGKSRTRTWVETLTGLSRAVNETRIRDKNNEQ